MSVFLIGVNLSKREFVVLSTVYVAFLTWYYVFSDNILGFVLGASQETFSIHSAVFNFIIGLAVVLSPFVTKKTSKASLFYTYHITMFIGAVFVFFSTNIVWKIVFYYFSAGAFGLGVFLFCTRFWELTSPEERGRIGGSIVLIGIVLYPIVFLLSKYLDFVGTIFLCATLSLEPAVIRLLDQKNTTRLTAGKNLKENNPERRTIVLYLVPWLIFSFINSTLARNVSFNIHQISPRAGTLLSFIQVVGTVVGVVMGGTVADFVGRRASLAIGLTSYGFSSALAGFTQTPEIFDSVYLVNGLSWGFLLALYPLVIWGDLANADSCGRRYSLGLASYYFCLGVGWTFIPQIFQISLTNASLLICLMIFSSNIPVIFAPEVLPSDFHQKIRFKLHIYLAKKQKQSRTHG